MKHPAEGAELLALAAPQGITNQLLYQLSYAGAVP
jgi:hypothetical protein